MTIVIAYEKIFTGEIYVLLHYVSDDFKENKSWRVYHCVFWSEKISNFKLK